MSLKSKIKKIIPDKLLHFYYLKKLESRKNKTIEEIKRIIEKEYEKKIGRKLDWDNPKTYTEKINISKLFCASEIKTRLSDKIAVRDWIKEKIGEEYLIPLLGVYDSIKEINFDELPNQFVIKCNHDSNSVFVCKDKSKINKKELEERYDNYLLKRNFAYVGYEMHYKDIKPKIIVEKYMGENIKDYKFLCFNGKPYYCWVDVDRFVNHKRNIYDLEWNKQPFSLLYSNFENELSCPSKFEKMKEISKFLCQDFEQVRVDLYEINGKIYFGEMTFTNENGFGKIEPDEWDYKLGELWKFEEKNRY